MASSNAERFPMMSLVISLHVVPNTTSCQDVLRTTRCVLYFFTQATDSNVNGSDIAKIIIAPYGLKQMLTCHDLSNMVCQMMQQFKLTMGQLNLLTMLRSEE